MSAFLPSSVQCTSTNSRSKLWHLYDLKIQSCNFSPHSRTPTKQANIATGTLGNTTKAPSHSVNGNEIPQNKRTTYGKSDGACWIAKTNRKTPRGQESEPSMFSIFQSYGLRFCIEDPSRNLKCSVKSGQKSDRSAPLVTSMCYVIVGRLFVCSVCLFSKLCVRAFGLGAV